ncbi:hypothetical protein C0991_008468 [Blastosporella zonata]|nr:hypothetical protein C0991_010137 [Blastosporella zonata]KAG6864584.1 hypothetical protein C0991_008468 [Blastosporella zonata]
METGPDALARDSPALRAVKDITFGSIAGMVSKVFEHPFDLTKVRLQSQVLDSYARFSGPIDCLVKTWKNEGVSGLYRGLPAPIVGAMVENASLFLVYGELQSVIRNLTARPLDVDPTLPQLALAAAGAGMFTSFLLTPIELVKCKMQVQMLVTPTGPGSLPLPGPISVLLGVVRTTGLRGLWLGHTGTLLRETGGTAAWFSTKEFVARILVARRKTNDRAELAGSGRAHSGGHGSGGKVQLKPWESAVSGACAGAAFNFVLFPADSVKSAMQTEEELRPRNGGPNAASQVPKATFLSTAKAMYKAQGIRGLYAGCGITVARSIPSSAIIFLIYDGLSTRFA